MTSPLACEPNPGNMTSNTQATTGPLTSSIIPTSGSTPIILTFGSTPAIQTSGSSPTFYTRLGENLCLYIW